MATTTLTTLRQEVGQELDIMWLIANGDITLAAGSATIIDPRVRSTNNDTNTFRDKDTIVTRLGAASAADFYRPAGDLTASSGAIAVSPNWADTTLGSETIELWFHGLIAGKEILDAINRAHRDVFFNQRVAISHLSGLDGDMSLSTDSDWTNVGTPTTSAKATTARRTRYGLRSYQLVADAANEGTQTATLGATQDSRFKSFVISSCDSGTFSHQGYNVTGSAAIGSAVTHSEEEPQLTMLDWQSVGASTKEVALQLLGTVNPTDFYVNAVWLYKEDNLRLPFPSFVSEYFMAPYIEAGIPSGKQTAANVWTAESMEFFELTEGKDYQLLSDNHPEAVPYGIRLLDRKWFDYPLFVQARRPYSDLVTFSAETDSTTCPINLLKPRVKQEIIDTVLIPRGINRSVATYQRVGAQRDWERANAARPIKKESQRRRWGGIPRA